jgi:predicted esterase
LIGSADSELVHSGDLAGTPTFLGSGDPDVHVPRQRVQETAKQLRHMKADVALRRYPGMPHSVNPEEITSARAHIRVLSTLERKIKSDIITADPVG